MMQLPSKLTIYEVKEFSLLWDHAWEQGDYCLDFSNSRELDASAIQLILANAIKAKRNNLVLQVSNIKLEVRNLLKRAGFWELFLEKTNGTENIDG